MITAIIPYDLWGREDGNSKHPQACSYTMGCFMHCGAFWQEEPPKPKKPKKAGFFLEPAWVCWIWWFGTSLTLPLKHKAMRFGISSSMLCWDLGSVFCGRFMPFPIVLGRSCTTWCKISCINKQLYYCTTFLSSGCFFLCNLTSLFFFTAYSSAQKTHGVSRSQSKMNMWLDTKYRDLQMLLDECHLSNIGNYKHNRCNHVYCNYVIDYSCQSSSPSILSSSSASLSSHSSWQPRLSLCLNMFLEGVLLFVAQFAKQL